MRKLLFAVLGLVLMAAPVFADQTPQNATQGQLAGQLAWRLGLGADNLPAQEAARRLEEAGVAPWGGWQVDQALTYGNLHQVLHQSYGSFDTNYPDKLVPWTLLGPIMDSEDQQTGGFWRWRHNYRQLNEP